VAAAMPIIRALGVRPSDVTGVMRYDDVWWIKRRLDPDVLIPGTDDCERLPDALAAAARALRVRL